MITPLSHPDTRRHTGASAAGSRLGRLAGGMAGWQITLIALAAALAAATAAVFIDRAGAARRAAPATTA